MENTGLERTKKDRTLRCELTIMCMLCDGSRVLVQSRNDKVWGGITFPGGHIEPGETIVDAVVREMQEETGLTVSGLQICGVKHWQARDPERLYLVFLYRASAFTGELRSSEEGRVFWIEREDIPDHTWATGMDSTLKVLLNDEYTEDIQWEEDAVWHGRVQ